MSAALGFARIFGVLVLAVVAACSPVPKPGEALVPDGATVTHRAVFIGESNHSTVGTISLYQSDEDPVIVFEPNFDLPDAPDAATVVALGRDGYRSDTILGNLLRNKGRQAYSIPQKHPIAKFNEVWLWSVTGDRPVGLARLTPIL